MSFIFRKKALSGVLFILFLVVVQCNLVASVQTNDGFEAMSQGDKNTDSTQQSTTDDWFAGDDSTTHDSIIVKNTTGVEKSTGTVYPLAEIGGATLFLYLITWLLSRFKVFKKNVHRKLWNVILLISFMVSGLLGLMLVVQINYDVMGDWYSTFMWLHVDFGIVMAIISIFHILWHTKYFATIMKNKKH